MRTFIPAIVAGLVISISAPAFAGDTAQPVGVAPVTAQPAVATAQPAGERVICKQIAHEGMLVKTSACHNAAGMGRTYATGSSHEVADFQNRNYQTSRGH